MAHDGDIARVASLEPRLRHGAGPRHQDAWVVGVGRAVLGGVLLGVGVGVGVGGGVTPGGQDSGMVGRAAVSARLVSRFVWSRMNFGPRTTSTTSFVRSSGLCRTFPAK